MSSTYASLARLALPHWGFSEGAELRLLNLSENATYLITEGAREAVLRVHRVGYHDRAAIESELAWAAALRADLGLITPTPLPSLTGELVVEVPQAGPDGEQATTRHLVLFEKLPGHEPPPDQLEPYLPTLGTLTAQMHGHVRDWVKPAGFTRFRWDAEAILGPEARWGRWQDGLGVGHDEARVLGAAADLVAERLRDYGDGPDRFDLVHADTRLANLLVDRARPDRIAILDFDDSGTCWYLFDFAATVSFVEHDPRLGRWWRRWRAGYEVVRALDDHDLAMASTFVMLRRLMLVAWLGSHHFTDIAAELGVQYTVDSCVLARDYVASTGWSREVCS